jgi:hypothetical protein
MKKEGYHEGLEDFQSVLTTFTRYRWELSTTVTKHVCYSVYGAHLAYHVLLYAVMFTSVAYASSRN